MYRIGTIQFDERELRDLAAAWLALGVAFTLFLAPRGLLRARPSALLALGDTFVLSMITVGTGFLLHELAHKVVAIRFGQIAAFRADYTFLAIAIASGLAGFLFAAPGAVYHRGAITDRQHGLVAVAGPVTNIVLALIFLLPALLTSGFIGEVAHMGVLVNVFLAAFNMLPAGPLDGKTVYRWHRGVFAVTILVAVGFGAAFVLGVGL